MTLPPAHRSLEPTAGVPVSQRDDNQAGIEQGGRAPLSRPQKQRHRSCRRCRNSIVGRNKGAVYCCDTCKKLDHADREQGRKPYPKYQSWAKETVDAMTPTDRVLVSTALDSLVWELELERIGANRKRK